MSKISAVMKTQRKLFFKDKGMLLFYGLGVVGFGVVFPLIFKNILSQLTLVMFMCVTMQKQWTAESVAGEREAKTLESVLSSPLHSRAFLMGKVLFNFICALVYAAAMAGCILITRYATTAPQALTAGGWAVCGAAALCVFLLTALYGVLCSARADTVRTAGRGPTIVCYLLTLLFIILLTILTTGDAMPVEGIVVIAVAFFFAAGSVIFYSLARILRMGRSDIIEVAQRQKGSSPATKGKGRGRPSASRQHSQVGSVFVHEMHYLKTLKMLLLQFAVLALCPAGLQYTMWLMTGANDLNYTVLLTILLMPRIPTNLIAYSVGGEKAYKTGESILSTPVSVSALFWGKAAVPCLLSVVMLVVSAALNLVAANIFAWMDGTPFLFYTAGQLVLLAGVGLATSFIMVLASAIFSLKAKTPRKGLYYSTFLGMVFFLPATAIVYLAGGNLLLALLYFGVLLGVSIGLYRRVHGVTRAALMSSL